MNIRKEWENMSEKKRDKNIVKDTIGDPAFYNDQIDNKKEPMKKSMDTKKENTNKDTKPKERGF